MGENRHENKVHSSEDSLFTNSLFALLIEGKPSVSTPLRFRLAGSEIGSSVAAPTDNYSNKTASTENNVLCKKTIKRTNDSRCRNRVVNFIKTHTEEINPDLQLGLRARFDKAGFQWLVSRKWQSRGRAVLCMSKSVYYRPVQNSDQAITRCIFQSGERPMERF